MYAVVSWGGGQPYEGGRRSPGESGDEGRLCRWSRAGQPDICGRATDSEPAPVHHRQSKPSTGQHHLQEKEQLQWQAVVTLLSTDLRDCCSPTPFGSSTPHSDKQCTKRVCTTVCYTRLHSPLTVSFVSTRLYFCVFCWCFLLLGYFTIKAAAQSRHTLYVEFS